MFGFPVATCCGGTEQTNGWKASWAEFYAENRLGAILAECKRTGDADAALEAMLGRVIDEVVPRLLGDDHLKGVRPVVVHGGLCSASHGVGSIGEGPVEEVVFDPSCAYAHSEYDLGLMKMFGGFSPSFWKEYKKLVPRSEPVAEWEDRILLYEL